MHLQVVEPKKVFLAELALIGTFSVVLLRRMLHDVILAQHGQATHLAMILSDSQTEGRIMEY